MFALKKVLTKCLNPRDLYYKWYKNNANNSCAMAVVIEACDVSYG